jgi:NADH-quinone oxidoreductase subunit J
MANELTAFAFYLLSGIIILSALGVITARNPVHSVLLLILSFFTGAGLFILMGAEFLAMILIIVYVGAVAVLFLFVVMMLDIDIASGRRGFLNYLPLGLILGGVFLFEIITVLAALSAGDTDAALIQPKMVQAVDIGILLYTRYVHFFQIAGLVLLVAMIGAIVLTLRHRTNIKRQSPGEQSVRENQIKIVKINPGEGLGEL